MLSSILDEPDEAVDEERAIFSVAEFDEDDEDDDVDLSSFWVCGWLGCGVDLNGRVHWVSSRFAL